MNVSPFERVLGRLLGVGIGLSTALLGLGLLLTIVMPGEASAHLLNVTLSAYVVDAVRMLQSPRCICRRRRRRRAPTRRAVCQLAGSRRIASPARRRRFLGGVRCPLPRRAQDAEGAHHALCRPPLSLHGHPVRGTRFGGGGGTAYGMDFGGGDEVEEQADDATRDAEAVPPRDVDRVVARSAVRRGAVFRARANMPSRAGLRACNVGE